MVTNAIGAPRLQSTAAPRPAQTSPEPNEGFQVTAPEDPDLKKAALLRRLLNQKVYEARITWSHNVEGRTYAAPALGVDGSVVVSALDELVSFNQNGSERWRVPNGPAYFKVYNSPLALDDGTTVVGSQSGLYRLDAKGEEMWFRDIGEAAASPVKDPEGNLYVTTKDGRLHSFEGDGTLRWTFDMGDLLRGLRRQSDLREAQSDRDRLKNEDLSPERREMFEGFLKETEDRLALPVSELEVKADYGGGLRRTPQGNFIYFDKCGPTVVVSPDGKLVDSVVKGFTPAELKVGSLRPLELYGPSFETNTGFAFGPEGEMYAVQGNSHLRAMNPDLTTRWVFGGFSGKRVDQLSPEDADDALRAGNLGASTTPAVSPDGKAVYFGGGDGELRAVDRDGNLLWKHTTGGKMMGEGAVVVDREGTVYAHTGAGVQALSPGGEVLWSYDAGGDRSAHLAVKEDTVFLLTYTGKLFALNRVKVLNDARDVLAGDKPQSRIQLGEGTVTIGGITLKRRA